MRTLRRLPGARTTNAADDALSRPAQDAAGGRPWPTSAPRPRSSRLQPSTGDVLAVANRPVDSTFQPRARRGPTPPARTFKVISTAALLRDGLDPGQRRGPARGRSSSTARRSRTSRAARPAPPPSPTTSRTRATRRLSSSARGCPQARWAKVAKDYGVGRNYDLGGGQCPLAACRRARTRSAEPRR